MSPSTVTIESLDNEGRGVARVEGQAVFVEGALPGERVVIETQKRKPSYEIARAVAIARASPSRTTPRCPHFGVCGGCSLQHLEAQADLAFKRERVVESLRTQHIEAEMIRPGVMICIIAAFSTTVPPLLT